MNPIPTDDVGGDLGDLEARWHAALSVEQPAEPVIERWVSVAKGELAAERRRESFRFWTAAAAILVLGCHLGLAAASATILPAVLWSGERREGGLAALRVRNAALAEWGTAGWNVEKTTSANHSPM